MYNWTIICVLPFTCIDVQEKVVDTRTVYPGSKQVRHVYSYNNSANFIKYPALPNKNVKKRLVSDNAFLIVTRKPNCAKNIGFRQVF